MTLDICDGDDLFHTSTSGKFAVVEYTDIDQFSQDTRDFLLINESENNLVLGIAQILGDPTQQYFTSHYLMTIVRQETGVQLDKSGKQNRLCLVAVWTPIYNLVLSVCNCSDQQDKQIMFTSLQNHLIERNRFITGMFAQKDDAILFSNLWRDMCLKYMSQPLCITTKMSEKLYELQPIDLKVDNLQEQFEMKNGTDYTQSISTAIAANQISNSRNSHLVIQRMSSEDFDTCLTWMVQFQLESGFYSSVPHDLIRKLNKNRLDLLVKNDCIYTLRDSLTGQIVSMSAVNAETPNGGRVGWVYTPVEHRGKGYSQICVSRMCDRVFREKNKQKIFLFADKSNSAANHLYKKIGFREVCDVENLSFLYNEMLKSNM